MIIKPVEMFYTPSSWDEIHEWIRKHDQSERTHLTVVAVMAWNLACSLTHPTDGPPTKVENSEGDDDRGNAL